MNDGQMGASCVCLFPNDTVNAWATTCLDEKYIFEKGVPLLIEGRPKGSGSSRPCELSCEENNGHELFGFTYIRVETYSCSRGFDFPFNVTGPLLQYRGEGPPLEYKYAQLLARRKARLGDIHIDDYGKLTSADPSTAASPPRFAMQEQGIDCVASCTEQNEFCTAFSIDRDTGKRLYSVLRSLPDGTRSRKIDAMTIGALLGYEGHACKRDPIVITGTQITNTGNDCHEDLDLNLRGMEDFKASILIPTTVAGRITKAGEVREIVFDDPQEMVSLTVNPATMQRLIGGRVRMLNFTKSRLVFETQATCLLINTEEQ